MSKLIKNWDGKHYDRHSQHQKEWGNSLVQELKISGHERILDLGCGNGHTTRQLAMLVPNGEVLGIDASLEMLEVAKEKSLPNMRIELLDINEISFDTEFDIVFSNATLHWIHNHRKLLSNVCKALKPEGYLRVQFAADGNCSTLFSVLRRVMSINRYSDDLKDFKWPWFFPTLEEYNSLMQSVSFSDFRVWIENNDRLFKTEDEIVGWIDNPSLIPFMQALSDDNRKTFRDEVVKEMLSITRQDDGTYFEKFRRINVYAVK